MPLTKEQRAAISRANGRKSRGPKTDLGKRNSSRNALTHGLSNRDLDAQWTAVYRRFSAWAIKELQPRTAKETVLIHEYAYCHVQVLRAEWVEYHSITPESSTVDIARAERLFFCYSAPFARRKLRALNALLALKNEQNEPGFSVLNQLLDKVRFSGETPRSAQ